VTHVGEIRRAENWGGLGVLAAAALLFSCSISALAEPRDAEARALLRAVVDKLCPAGVDDPATLAATLPDLALSDVQDAGSPEAWRRREIRLVDDAADTAVVIKAFRSGGTLRRLDIEVRTLGDTRPLLLALADTDCTVVHARALRYEEGMAAELLLLAQDLETVTAREPLNPAVPAGTDAQGVTVAHIDSGVNYRLPQIAARLARDEAGRMLGYDFWDLDDRPFDGDTGRSPFFPIRHGTLVASLLLAEAPGVRLLPFRYPRPDMARMADAVAAAQAAGAAIVALPMGSTRQADWIAFEEAARAHPGMLFIVSAGNDGRDIDGKPLYPASLPLDNMIVVTSADAAGYAAPGSNWGAASVDLLVPAEDMAVTGFDGAPTRGSGSSFAVPRLAALAARLKAAHPDWQAKLLKRAIFARAVAQPADAVRAVAVGWIPSPAEIPD